MTSRRSAALATQVEQYLALSTQPKPLQIIYSTHSTWPYLPVNQSRQSKQVDIGVLDSSFNPPHLAHSALAQSKKPNFSDEEQGENTKNDYDSLLLIFSVRNADKGTGSKKDASTVDRLNMMKEFAKDLEERQAIANVAVAIVEEPLMIAKSTLIQQYIEKQQEQQQQQKDQEDSRSSPLLLSPPARLHWLVGFDTLQRFFQVKYYPSPDYFHQGCHQFFVKERTTFVCARRGTDSLPNKEANGSNEKDEEQELLTSETVKPWLDRGSVVMIDLEKHVQGVSSTLIRKTILAKEGGDDDKGKKENKLQQLTTKRVAQYLVQEPVYSNEDE